MCGNAKKKKRNEGLDQSKILCISECTIVQRVMGQRQKEKKTVQKLLSFCFFCYAL